MARSAGNEKRNPANKKSSKTGTKTARKTKETKSIKYADKSVNQPDLVPVFNELVSLLKPFAKLSLTFKGGTAGSATVSSVKPVEIAGKKLDELFFAGVLVQKGYVGFYFFPIYVHPDLKSELSPDLLKKLKGKTCFHIKKIDPETKTHINDALKKGYSLYKNKGWIS
ncbi:MAG TPA: hypothetical protein VF145_12240 [Chitinophagaceae bacterium]